MERLTYRAQSNCGDIWALNSPGFPIQAAIDRLAAYEDTGLEPEDVRGLQKEWTSLILTIGEMGGMPHFHDISLAEKDGRLVVLPCKVGDTVWICGSVRGMYSAKVRTFFIGHPSLRGTSDNSIQMIRTTECDIPIKDFGKIVFLTREEAEAALVDQKGAVP